jgi:hypothetical protein
MVKAGQLGAKAPPDLLAKPIMDLIDAILSPSEKQMVVQAVLGEGAKPGGQSGGSPGDGETPGAGSVSPPEQEAGNKVGMQGVS